MRSASIHFAALILLAIQVNADERKKSPISLTESLEISRKTFADPKIRELRRQYWKRTFDEIRNVSFRVTTPEGQKNVLSRWKRLSEPTEFLNATADGSGSDAKPLRRFDGFANWDRMLQDWTDDIQEYLDKLNEETGETYSLSNYGRPVASAPEAIVAEEANYTDTPVETLKEAPSTKAKKSTEAKGTLPRASVVPAITKSVLPIPAPAKEGENVLPHTDISDKSKRIEIVTTAALPWRTGTAVNALLRAAYLTEGRKSAGGGVTLMLPWLERRSDQEAVYGKDNTFASPEDQERYIRTWLRESAQMKEASEDIGIRWYTAWQNPTENSIYSMGDITALIPAEEVDICILEEPEHLNW